MALNPFGSNGSDGDTPFDGSGLKLKNVKTRAELNKVEFSSILKVAEKYLLLPPSQKSAPFNYEWLLKLHEEMFGSIWEWAGRIRTSNRNIGVRWEMAPTELGALAMEAERRHDETGSIVIATAAEFHHKAVHAHPFEDGNGRWARMVANIWQFQHGMPITIWPDTGLRDTASSIREEYIEAIKQADDHNFDPLIGLHTVHLDSDE